jgi:hypothetical protein
MCKSRCATGIRRLWGIGPIIATILLLVVLSICFAVQAQAQHGKKDTGQKNKPEPLVPLVVPSGPWTGTIEVSRKVDEVKPVKAGEDKYVIQWSTMRAGGTYKYTDELHTNFKATLYITAASEAVKAANLPPTQVYGEVEYKYKSLHTEYETQKVRCRIPGRNPFVGKMTRTRTVEELTVQDKIGSEGLIDASGSVVWQDRTWHVRIHFRGKEFKTGIRSSTKVIECDGSENPAASTKFEKASSQHSDEVEFEADTGNVGDAATDLAGRAPLNFAGKVYNVIWKLSRK